MLLFELWCCNPAIWLDTRVQARQWIVAAAQPCFERRFFGLLHFPRKIQAFVNCIDFNVLYFAQWFLRHYVSVRMAQSMMTLF